MNGLMFSKVHRLRNFTQKNAFFVVLFGVIIGNRGVFPLQRPR